MPRCTTPPATTHASCARDTPVAEVDLRVGGTYRLGMRNPETGDVDAASAASTARSRVPSGWSTPGPGKGRRWAAARDGSTLSTHRGRRRDDRAADHTGFLGEEERAKHEHGWTALRQPRAGRARVGRGALAPTDAHRRILCGTDARVVHRHPAADRALRRRAALRDAPPRAPAAQGHAGPVHGAPARRRVARARDAGRRGRGDRRAAARRRRGRRRARPRSRRSRPPSARPSRASCSTTATRSTRRRAAATAGTSASAPTSTRSRTRRRAALRVCLADKLHNARSILLDYRTHGDALWARFRQGQGLATRVYYRELAAAFERERDRIGAARRARRRRAAPHGRRDHRAGRGAPGPGHARADALSEPTERRRPGAMKHRAVAELPARGGALSYSRTLLDEEHLRVARQRPQLAVDDPLEAVGHLAHAVHRRQHRVAHVVRRERRPRARPDGRSPTRASGSRTRTRRSSR